MKPSKTKIGKEGEQEARSYLEKRGYHIVCTNWHFHHYELDIIAEKEDELIVVEVKTRSEDFLVSPEDAVDEPKRTNLKSAGLSKPLMHTLAFSTSSCRYALILSP